MTSFKTVGTQPALFAGTGCIPEKTLQATKTTANPPGSVEIHARMNVPDIGTV
jgi:hypothetical protein